MARRAFVYAVANFPLFIQETDGIEFTLYSSHDGLAARIKTFLGLPARSRSTGDPISIRNPEIITPKIWNDPKEAPKEIAETGLMLENIQLSFINQMENIGVSSELKSNNGDLSLVTSKCFLWNARSIWGGIFASDGTVEFLPLTRRAAHKLLEPG